VKIPKAIMRQYIRSLLYILVIGVFVLAPTSGVNALTVRGLQSLNSEQGLYDPNTECGTDTTSAVPTENTASPIESSAEQETNARTIIGIAKSYNLGEKGALVGLMTGLQESSMRNPANSTVPISMQNPEWLAKKEPRPIGNDNDSVGIMQQRVPMGWSTFGTEVTQDSVWQLMNVAYAAQAFFGTPKDAKLPADLKLPSALKKGLQNVNGWETMDPAKAAQEVQRSGVPDGYVKRRGEAQKLMDKYYASSPPVPLPIPVTGGTAPAGTGSSASSGSTAGSGADCTCTGGSSVGSGAIVIDPGHGGTSTVTVTDATGLRDSDYPSDGPEMQDVWEVSGLVEKGLKAAGYTVVLTKNDVKQSRTLRQRAETANSINAALGVSIHTQASGSGGGGLAWANANNIVYPQAVGLYRQTPDGKKIEFTNAAIAKSSQDIADIFVKERTAAEGHTVKMNNPGNNYAVTSIDGRGLAPGNIWMVQLFAKMPWIYNEAGGDSPGQKGLSAADKQKYANGIINSVKKAVPPGSGAAAAPSTPSTTETPAATTPAPTTTPPATSSSGCAASGGTGVTAIKNKIFEYAWPDYCKQSSGNCKGYASPITMKDPYKAASDAATKQGEYIGACGGVDCGGFVTRVMRDSGADPDYNRYPQGNTTQQIDYLRRNSGDGKKYTRVTNINLLETGDIAIKADGNEGHTFFYVGKITGPNGEPFNGDSASASMCKRAPMAGPTDTRSDYEWYRLTNPSAATVKNDGKKVST
jgi:N-acetylmuramoyl-L-alanine amidase